MQGSDCCLYRVETRCSSLHLGLSDVTITLQQISDERLVLPVLTRCHVLRAHPLGDGFAELRIVECPLPSDNEALRVTRQQTGSVLEHDSEVLLRRHVKDGQDRDRRRFNHLRPNSDLIPGQPTPAPQVTHGKELKVARQAPVVDAMPGEEPLSEQLKIRGKPALDGRVKRLQTREARVCGCMTVRASETGVTLQAHVAPIHLFGEHHRPPDEALEARHTTVIPGAPRATGEVPGTRVLHRLSYSAPPPPTYMLFRVSGTQAFSVPSMSGISYMRRTMASASTLTTNICVRTNSRPRSTRVFSTWLAKPSGLSSTSCSDQQRRGSGAC